MTHISQQHPASAPAASMVYRPVASHELPLPPYSRVRDAALGAAVAALPTFVPAAPVAADEVAPITADMLPDLAQGAPASLDAAGLSRPDFTQQRMRSRFGDDRRGGTRPMKTVSIIGGGPGGTIA